MKPAFNVRQQSEIFIGPLADILSGVLPEGRVVVVSDSTIDRLYHSVLAQYDTVLIGLGESVKTMQTVEMIYRRFIELGVDRSTFVLAVGGGIVTDVAGFAASTYMRGVKFGFVSTTLLGQVDASVGGKNGVNFDGYKIMAGTFTQPQFVICDPALLRTLPEREFRAGLAEIVKAGLIADRELFGLFESHSLEEFRRDRALLGEAVMRAVKVKAHIVERDERESDERRKLNLGHTFAHAIEKCSRDFLHGEAVAIGTVMIARLSERLGTVTAEEAARVRSVFERMGLPVATGIEPPRLIAALKHDKKKEARSVAFVLMRGIGDCEIRPMTFDEIDRTADLLK